jgi:predicted AAA+ superfamily ATPase
MWHYYQGEVHMPHIRHRFLVPKCKKLLGFWPVVGIIGPRQSGKTTLITKLMDKCPVLSLDDLALRNEANLSPKAFLARLPRPVVLDEAQKAPDLFDAIKLVVDQKRVPGEFLLTGSSSFSARAGIRESLTGRIGLLRLRSMTLAELQQDEPRALKSLVTGLDTLKPRYSIGDVSKSMQSGGMPGAAFVRDDEHRQLYWSSWLETTLNRDLPRLFSRGYDPDVALSLLQQLGKALREGQLPTIAHFDLPPRRLRQYLDALCEIFVLQRVPMHSRGRGKDVWLCVDSGLARFLMGEIHGLSAQLSLCRHFLWNEWLVHQSLQASMESFHYYKSAQGSPVDAVLEGVPILVTADADAVSRRLSWLERPLRGAMKTLEANSGIIAAPVDHIIPATSNDGVAIVPWSLWS